MKIKVFDLIPGYVLSEDVMGKTAHPIMPKGTLLTRRMINVLKEFDIEEVSVGQFQNAGQGCGAEEKQMNPVMEKLPSGFQELYNAAVNSYKKNFQSWQAGSKVNVGEVRDYFIPLFQYIEKDPSNIRLIHRYSTKEEYMYHHAVSVGLLSGAIAQKLNLEKGACYQAALAGCLADAGMAKVPQHLLKKTDPLTETEFEEIKSHPVYGLQMVQHTSLLKSETKLAILQHHERLDRSGYPFRENPGRIPILSRIVAVSDVYHAIVCDHIYKKKKIPFQAIEELLEDHFGEFDISVVNALIRLVAHLSIGTKVILSNNEVAEVIYTKPSAPIKPLVKILSSDEMVDLETRRDLFIKEMIK
ncbi:HD family phosphohydrolase [Weizmannia acidilactici]|uniref:HD family phosphohydrolase n=1 Tax=Weizmannia acidilactici TaxID=2607726 RepID=A0A5J4JHV6_9BACI|nr:HD-GYP domain-containing protein [Weizmannia acidilactici]GER67292.1 HD family phosphohydrolase [Weizmannia acidilactici]GER70008.1 HD family phosphohydrolase [Weizmannia acidilactici]GER74644.1 HD family phosphohydrolase [Weizmannia acidilactici]